MAVRAIPALLGSRGTVSSWLRASMDLLASVTHPSEVWALLKVRLGGGVAPRLDQASLPPRLRRCYQLLGQTSRSFSAVIQALDDGLRNAVCVFYLVLRALDTVEDDMTIPMATKVRMLRQFHTYLHLPEWSYSESSEKDRAVLEEFPVISAEFRGLLPVYQTVIEDITRDMGNGMTVFLEEKIGTIVEWDEYCHYVAGLVGIGLSRLFSASGKEVAQVGKDVRLSNSMGLFLQKTNIIRDYLEDSLDGREFWPREVWGQFASELRDFQRADTREAAVHCLNFLITNALQHVVDVLKYMGRIRNQSVFNFCAIPQTMAIATLAACYNNPHVFEGVVKIRKGQAVALMVQSTDMTNLRSIMAQFLLEISSKIDPRDPSAAQTRAVVDEILELCHASSATPPSVPAHRSMPLQAVGVMAAAAFLYVCYSFLSMS